MKVGRRGEWRKIGRRRKIGREENNDVSEKTLKGGLEVKEDKKKEMKERTEWERKEGRKKGEYTTMLAKRSKRGGLEEEDDMEEEEVKGRTDDRGRH